MHSLKRITGIGTRQLKTKMGRLRWFGHVERKGDGDRWLG